MPEWTELPCSGLQAAEALVQRIEENIAFQGQMIATLDGGGHDVEAAKMFLRRLEATHARHVADRDQLLSGVAFANVKR